MSAEHHRDLLAGASLEVSYDPTDPRYVILTARLPVGPEAAQEPPPGRRMEGPAVFSAWVCLCAEQLQAHGLLSPGERQAIHARLVGIPEALTRETVGAALATRRAAQAPLDAAAVAAIEARVAQVDLAPALAKAREQGAPLPLGACLVDLEVFAIICPLFGAPFAPPPAQHDILVIVLDGLSLEPFAGAVDLPLPEPGAGVAVVFDIDGHRGALRVVVPAEEPAPPQGGAVS